MLEIDLSSDRNMMAVDLFDRRHARAVLAAFGRGHGDLPEDPEALTDEQKKFLDEAIDGLAEGDRVICVPAGPVCRDVQGPALDPVELEGAGGNPGGRRRLSGGDDRVGGAASRAQPAWGSGPDDSGVAITAGRQPAERSDSFLCRASGGLGLSASAKASFRELLRVLDSELRLLTPAEEPDAATWRWSRGGASRTVRC